MSNSFFKSRVRENISDVQSVINNALNQILNREFELSLKFSEKEEINSFLVTENYPRIAVSFTSGANPKSVRHLLLMDPDFLLKFHAWMLMDEPENEITDDHFDGLKEGFQQIFGQVKMAVADEKGNFDVRDIKVVPAENLEDLQEFVLEGQGALCTYNLASEEQSYQINQFMWPEHPKQFAERANTAKAGAQPKKQYQDDHDNSSSIDIQTAEFGNISYSGDTPGDGQNVSMLLDVELEIRVEIDRKTLLVSDLLKLGKGSIVEMEKSAGEPLDVFVNGRKFAEGEVVVIDDRFGIRITQLLSPKDRVKSLGPAF
jgi:flagellar motor switch protein FliN/FliY